MPAEPDTSALLVTTVDIGDGKAASIELHEGDDPVEVAQAFCKTHGLPDGVVAPLAAHLQEHLLQEAPLGLEDPRQSGIGTGEGPSRRSSDSDLRLPRTSTGITRMSKKQEAQRKLQRHLLEKQLSGVHRGQAHLMPVLGVGGQKGGSPVKSPSKDKRSSEGSGEDRYERLYKLAAELATKHEQARNEKMRAAQDLTNQAQRSITWRSQQLTKGRDQGECGNSGERMHLEALLDLQRREERAARARAQQAEQELAELTLTPQISRMAQALRREGQGHSFERLNKRSTHTLQDRMQALRQEMREREVLECTFRPTINGPSSRQRFAGTIVEGPRTSHFEALYEDAIARAAKAQEAATQMPSPDYTFRPKLIANRKASGQPVNLTAHYGSVSDRLWDQHRKAQQRLLDTRTEMEQLVDPETGAPFFEPTSFTQTYRSSAVRHEGQSIGDYLYAVGQDSARHLEELQRNFETTLAQMSSEPHTQAKSARLVERLKAKRLGQVFDYLVSAHQADGEDRLDLGALDPQVLDTLDWEVRADVDAAVRLHESRMSREGGQAQRDRFRDSTASADQVPSLVDLANMDSSRVEQEQFVGLMMQVLQRSAGVPRAYLLPAPLVNDHQEPTFTPEIKARSKVLAARRRPENVPAYELLHAMAGATREKMEGMRMQAQEALLQECTFSPELVSALGKTARGKALRAAMQGTGRTLNSENSAFNLDSPRHSTLEVSPEEAGDGAKRAAALQSLVQNLMEGGASPDDVAIASYPLYDAHAQSNEGGWQGPSLEQLAA
ncbi:hypothetical protein WJX73_009342 [Symbiochloris irregularis]|uniref:Uncharacterized protein n=1 Tax=Symbiochloris irregularis TaxID=706552 RepID=A0AAW1NXU5_9CHLO